MASVVSLSMTFSFSFKNQNSFKRGSTAAAICKTSWSSLYLFSRSSLIAILRFLVSVESCVLNSNFFS
jgi:hypothetical protein